MTNIDVAPTTWSEFIGQEKIKNRLEISIEAAKRDGRQMEHILLLTGPGQGKTTLARLIAQRMDATFKQLMMPVSPKVLNKTIIDSEGVLLLDEVHRLKKAWQEELLLVLEENAVQLASGEQRQLPNDLTIIAATTDSQSVIQPLKDRFTHRPTFEQYTDEEMGRIVKQMADRSGLKVTKAQAVAFGRASANTPRQARSILRMARDLRSSDPKVVLPVLGYTEDGLTEDHIKYLKALEMLDDRAGISSIANHTGYPQEILRDLEKLLVRREYITLTAKGRAMMLKGTQFLVDLRTDDE